MKWQLKQPSVGDMIRVGLNGIYHYGVFISNDEVIQFGLPPVARMGLNGDDIEVCASDMATFLSGGCLEVAEFDQAEKNKNRHPDEVVDYARSRIGEGGYNILYNNCEHFAYDCVTGKPHCSQTSDLRAFFRSLPVVDVYLARIPEEPRISILDCAERNAEIEKINHEKTKVEKYYVWKLLEYALERSFGLRSSAMTFTKTDSGKWTSEKCAFSLSHCDGVVSVAVSRGAVGIDIEKAARPISKERFANKILSADEYAVYEGMPKDRQEGFLLEKWTAKESLFKKSEKVAFIPRDYDTTVAKVHTQTVSLADCDYVISVATDTPEGIRLYMDVDLSNL